MYPDSVQRNLQNKRNAFLDDGDLPYTCDEKGGADDELFRNKAAVRMTREVANIVLWMYGWTAQHMYQLRSISTEKRVAYLVNFFL